MGISHRFNRVRAAAIPAAAAGVFAAASVVFAADPPAFPPYQPLIQHNIFSKDPPKGSRGGGIDPSSQTSHMERVAHPILTGVVKVDDQFGALLMDPKTEKVTLTRIGDKVPDGTVEDITLEYIMIKPGEATLARKVLVGANIAPDTFVSVAGPAMPVAPVEPAVDTTGTATAVTPVTPGMGTGGGAGFQGNPGRGGVGGGRTNQRGGGGIGAGGGRQPGGNGAGGGVTPPAAVTPVAPPADGSDPAADLKARRQKELDSINGK